MTYTVDRLNTKSLLSKAYVGWRGRNRTSIMRVKVSGLTTRRLANVLADEAGFEPA